MDSDANAKLANSMMDVVMGQAYRDKLAEAKEIERAANEQTKPAYTKQIQAKDDDDEEDFMDEDEKEIFEKMKKERMKELEDKLGDRDDEEEDRKLKKENLWYGEYTEIVEQEFLTYVTKADFSVCHFFHKDFERCKIIDKHLQIIARDHKECKFLKLDAEKSPFFVNKLAIKMLPTICLFKKGVLVDQIVGFEELGGKDDFKTINLTRKLVNSGILKPLNKAEKGIRINRGGKTSDDSESDDDF